MLPDKKVQLNYIFNISKLMLAYCHKKKDEKNFKSLIKNQTDLYRKTNLYDFKKKNFSKKNKKKWEQIVLQIKIYSKLEKNKFIFKSMKLLKPYLVKRVSKIPKLVEYNTKAKFGCFDYSIIKNTVDLHMPVFQFINHKKKKKFSIKKNKLILRATDLSNLVNDVKKKYPEIKKIQMGSWLNQYSQFRVLFPKSWRPNGKFKKKNSIAWWGQFLKSNGKINRDLYNKFLKNCKFKYLGKIYFCNIRDLDHHLLKLKKNA